MWPIELSDVIDTANVRMGNLPRQPNFTVEIVVASRIGRQVFWKQLECHRIAELLASDRDDMVIKGMSWALRELIPVDRRAVERFLRKHDDVVAARVKREVRNKLTTGLKNPRSKGKAARGRDSV